MRQLPLGVRLSDRARLDSFAIGPNGEAVEAVRRLVEPSGSGVLWLWGPSGSGRSHLLQAACAAVGPSGYFPLAELAPLGPEALEGAGGLSCVAIDDVARVAGDAAFERALFYLYRELEAAGGRLLLAADRAPMQAGFRLADLASRLGAADVRALRSLDEAEQREALRLRAAMRGLELPDDTARYLQRRYPRDMRSLLEVLERLDAAALLAQRRLTIPFIREALANPSDARPVSPPDARADAPE